MGEGEANSFLLAKFVKRLIFILEKGTFFFAPFCPVVARTRLEFNSEFFGGPEISVLGPKIQFLPYGPNLVDGPFVALKEMIHFQLSERFFDYSFPS